MDHTAYDAPPTISPLHLLRYDAPRISCLGVVGHPQEEQKVRVPQASEQAHLFEQVSAYLRRLFARQARGRLSLAESVQLLCGNPSWVWTSTFIGGLLLFGRVYGRGTRIGLMRLCAACLQL